MTTHLIKVLKNIGVELLIIWLLILSINNYFGNVQQTISADGIGYYDYLPSIFIHKDLIRKDQKQEVNPALYKRINSFNSGAYIDYNSYKVNKYPCGTAFLISPFFITAYLLAPPNNHESAGYTPVYQKAVFYAALFYLFLTLLFFKKLLELYNITRTTIILSQLLMVFATSVIHYTYNEAAFSHIYSLFAICAFMYFSKSYFINKNLTHFLWACAILGVIFILRYINVLIILFIPFLAGSPQNFRSGVLFLFRHPKVIFKSILFLLLPILLQCSIWYLQTGDLILDSYKGEGFNFLNPAFINILFSYKKGLFIYAPALFITMFGLIKLIADHKYYLFFTWTFFFIILTYFLSSWWSWYYGSSYGLRAYIEFYPAFFILFSILIEKLNLWLKTVVLALSLLTVPINFIQTRQYKEYILHWYNMDESKYWQIFLKQDARFNGFLWKREYDFNEFEKVDEIYLGNIKIPSHSIKTIFKISGDKIKQLEKVNVIQVIFDNVFSEEEEATIQFNIKDTTKNISTFNQELPLVHFAENGFDKLQTGLYNYGFLTIKDRDKQEITIKVNSNKNEIFLKNIRVLFLKQK